MKKEMVVMISRALIALMLAFVMAACSDSSDSGCECPPNVWRFEDDLCTCNAAGCGCNVEYYDTVTLGDVYATTIGIYRGPGVTNGQMTTAIENIIAAHGVMGDRYAFMGKVSKIVVIPGDYSNPYSWNKVDKVLGLKFDLEVSGGMASIRSIFRFIDSIPEYP